MRNNLFSDRQRSTDSGKEALTVGAFSNVLLISTAKGGEPQGRRTALPQARDQILLEIRGPLK